MVTQFGSGNLWAVPTLVQGAIPANPVPQKFGVLQDVQLDVSEDLKELHGQLKFPVDISAGKAKITGKAKMASIIGSMFASLYFNETAATGVKLQATHPSTVIPSTPFQITVTNGATSFRDLGVYYTATGLFLQRVASAPTVGQYSVNVTTGVYTFAAADTGAFVTIDYMYTSAATGKGFTITNRAMGDKPEFEVFLIQSRKGKQSGWRLNRCVSTKLTLATKLDDFTVPEFDFSAFADDSGNVGEIWSPE
jgi:hypothetical protein